MAYKMKGFSGFKESPVKAADEALLDASDSMYSEDTAETIANIDPLKGVSLRKNKEDSEDEEDSEG